ncbi:MAG: hypothetical protein PUC12_17230 [Clostridiales bacterium]|nr:hypothetical protein [Clostridiales bacterium]
MEVRDNGIGIPENDLERVFYKGFTGQNGRNTAKTNLIKHYMETLDAHLLDRQNMYIDTYGAIKLINKYFKEGLS